MLQNYLYSSQCGTGNTGIQVNCNRIIAVTQKFVRLVIIFHVNNDVTASMEVKDYDSVGFILSWDGWDRALGRLDTTKLHTGAISCSSVVNGNQ